jgi:uncharacterized protein YjbJ (UPF0337 family)
MIKRIAVGQWRRLRGKLKERWGHIIEDEQRIVDGLKEQLVGTLLAYGYALEQADQEARAFYAQTPHLSKTRMGNVAVPWRGMRYQHGNHVPVDR